MDAAGPIRRRLFAPFRGEGIPLPRVLLRDLNLGAGGLVADTLRAHGVLSDPLAALDAEVGLRIDLCVRRARFVVRPLNHASARACKLLSMCLISMRWPLPRPSARPRA